MPHRPRGLQYTTAIVAGFPAFGRHEQGRGIRVLGPSMHYYWTHRKGTVTVGKFILKFENLPCGFG